MNNFVLYQIYSFSTSMWSNKNILLKMCRLQGSSWRDSNLTSLVLSPMPLATISTSFNTPKFTQCVCVCFTLEPNLTSALCPHVKLIQGQVVSLRPFICSAIFSSPATLRATSLLQTTLFVIKVPTLPDSKFVSHTKRIINCVLL